MKVFYLTLVTFFLSFTNYCVAQTTVTIPCIGTTGSLNSGSITTGCVKNDGNITNICVSCNGGWASFNLSSIPAFSTINSVTLNFTTYSSTSSAAANGLSGFVGTPSSMDACTLWSRTASTSNTNFNTTAWTANALNSMAFNASGISFVQANVGYPINIGFRRGGTGVYNIGGYPGNLAAAPSLVINYTPPFPCSGIPGTGTVTTSTTQACVGVNFTVSLLNIPAFGGLTFQWQKSDDGVHFSNIASATASSLTTTQSDLTYYRNVVGCSNSGLSANSDSKVVDGCGRVPIGWGTQYLPGQFYEEDDYEDPSCMPGVTSITTDIYPYFEIDGCQTSNQICPNTSYSPLVTGKAPFIFAKNFTTPTIPSLYQKFTDFHRRDVSGVDPPVIVEMTFNYSNLYVTNTPSPGATYNFSVPVNQELDTILSVPFKNKQYVLCGVVVGSDANYQLSFYPSYLSIRPDVYSFTTPAGSTGKYTLKLRSSTPDSVSTLMQITTNGGYPMYYRINVKFTVPVCSPHVATTVIKTPSGACSNGAVLARFTNPSMPSGAPWTAVLSGTNSGNNTIVTKSAVRDSSILFDLLPDGTYRIIAGASGSTCVDTSVIVLSKTPPVCKGSLNMFTPSSIGYGCLGNIVVTLNTADCYSNWTAVISTGLNDVGFDQKFGNSGQLIAFDQVPGASDSTFQYYISAVYYAGDSTCIIRDTLVPFIKFPGCDGTVQSVLNNGSPKGCNNGSATFSLHTTSCMDHWQLFLNTDNVQDTFYLASYPDDSIYTVKDLAPGTYNITAGYANFCVGDFGTITIPELPPVIYFADMDGDGFGDVNSQKTFCSSTPPAGYVTDSTDCNDDLNSGGQLFNPLTVWYKDMDGDGYSDGTTFTGCQGPPGYYVAAMLDAISGDCNDDPNSGGQLFNPLTVWYKDMDGDGYSDGTTFTGCQGPPGYYVAAMLDAISGDCNDDPNSGGQLFNPLTVWYKDMDGDGYSDGTTFTGCQGPPGYYVAAMLDAISGDCNDDLPDGAHFNPLTVWYKDMDGDGYSDGTTFTGCQGPPGYYVAAMLDAISGDCNDDLPDGAHFNPLTVWYKDMDGDGYSDGTTFTGCQGLPGYYVAAMLEAISGDCNDGDGTVHPGATEICYDNIDNNCNGQIDEAHSIFSSGIIIPSVWTAASIPLSCGGFVANVILDYFPTISCWTYWEYTWGAGIEKVYFPQTSIVVQVPYSFPAYTGGVIAFIAFDQTGSQTLNAFVPPIPSSIFYKDADGDGYGDPSTGRTVTICEPHPLGYVTDYADCNDDPNNDGANEYPGQTWYQDADGDGYTSGNTLTQCLRPTGYKLQSELTGGTTDCNDNPNNGGANEHPGQIWYQDADGDGYTNGNTLTQCSRQAGYKLQSELINTITDCNDDPNNGGANVHASFTFYVDGDGDGYGSITTANVCAANANTPPAGYSANNTDCNDNDKTVWQSASLYIDADGDGYDAGTAIVCYGTTVPTGYSLTTNGTDCMDNDKTVWQSASLYIDADGDGYDAGTAVVCYGTTVPTGYSLTSKGTDCRDDLPNVHPGATEICGNGLDDDCVGGDAICPAPLNITAVISNTICTGTSNGSIDVTVTGGAPPYTYLWSNGATTQDISGLATGNYRVTVTAQLNISSAASFTVGMSPGISSIAPARVTSNKANNRVCSGQAVTLTEQNGTLGSFAQYLWFQGSCSGTPIGSGASITVTPLVNTSYFVRAAGACNTTSCVSITFQVSTSLAVAVTKTDNQCFGGNQGTATANASGGFSPYTYTWSNVRTTRTINGLIAGAYTVTVTDAPGCSISATTTIGQNPAIVIAQSQINVTTLGGRNGSATATASGGAPGNPPRFNYSWSNGVVNNNTLTSTINRLRAGTYSVTVTKSGCSQTATYNITQPLAKTDETEETDVPILNTEEKEISEALMRVYPNPFADKLNFEFSLPEDSRGKLEIFNIEGQLLAILFEGDVKANELHKLEFTPTGTCDCMIIYRLHTEQGTYYGKAMMIK